MQKLVTYTPAEVAGMLKVSTDTIIRTFEKRNGVLIQGKAESRFKRKYRTIRIPEACLQRYIAEISVR